MGNIAHQPFLATQTRAALLGRSLSASTISEATQVLREELKAALRPPSVSEPPFVVVEASYRLALAPALFAKAALRAAAQQGMALTEEQRSAVEEPLRPASSGQQPRGELLGV